MEIALMRPVSRNTQLWTHNYTEQISKDASGRDIADKGRTGRPISPTNSETLLRFIEHQHHERIGLDFSFWQHLRGYCE